MTEQEKKSKKKKAEESPAGVGFGAEQLEQLGQGPPQDAIKTRVQAGRELSYLEGWYCIDTANKIFGHSGWSSEILVMRETVQSKDGDQWLVGYVARVKVTAGGVSHEGVGFGSGQMRSLAQSSELAGKEAATDATKRALIHFGSPFGLSLYGAKSQETATGYSDPAPRSNGGNVSPSIKQLEYIDKLVAGANMTAPQLEPLLLDNFGVKTAAQLDRGEASDLIGFLKDNKPLRGAEKQKETSQEEPPPVDDMEVPF